MPSQSGRCSALAATYSSNGRAAAQRAGQSSGAVAVGGVMRSFGWSLTQAKPFRVPGGRSERPPAAYAQLEAIGAERAIPHEGGTPEQAHREPGAATHVQITGRDPERFVLEDPARVHEGYHRDECGMPYVGHQLPYLRASEEQPGAHVAAGLERAVGAAPAIHGEGALPGGEEVAGGERRIAVQVRGTQLSRDGGGGRDAEIASPESVP